MSRRPNLPNEPAERSMLRFLTCGSVDDGKSTLIGRLLHDAGLLMEDQFATLQSDSRRHGTAGDDLDFALLMDGLEAEREQGITIDVAYRFFTTPRRKFIVADTPGHEQYTRNMASGASTADLALVLVDARKGILPQTRRLTFIASLLGIRHILLAVNKIDLVGYDRAVFDAIVENYGRATRELDITSVVAIPVSARDGENVVSRSTRTPWYDGPTILELLETVEVAEAHSEGAFRFPVQYVNRPNADFRGFSGTVASGRVSPGDLVVAAKSGVTSRVTRIVTADGDRDVAREGEAVTLVLEQEIELARGNMLAPPTARPYVADRFVATIVWFDENPLEPGRSYRLRTETDEVGVTVTQLTDRVDVRTLAREPASTLVQNEIGSCNLSTRSAIAFDTFAQNRATGSFILIDRVSNATVGAGMIQRPLRRASNIHWQPVAVDRAARAALKGQEPVVLWFTGLSGSGKSTIADRLERRLHAAGRHTYLLDGDNVRHGLNRDLGFTESDRVENIRRVGEVAKMMADAGLIVLVSFISPFRAERHAARELMAEGEFLEVFVDTSLAECERRDPKGLYEKARKGMIANFTGIDSPYERPEAPDLHLRTEGSTPDDLAEVVERFLAARGSY